MDIKLFDGAISGKSAVLKNSLAFAINPISDDEINKSSGSISLNDKSKTTNPKNKQNIFVLGHADERGADPTTRCDPSDYAKLFNGFTFNENSIEEDFINEFKEHSILVTHKSADPKQTTPLKVLALNNRYGMVSNVFPFSNSMPIYATGIWRENYSGRRLLSQLQNVDVAKDGTEGDKNGLFIQAITQEKEGIYNAKDGYNKLKTIIDPLLRHSNDYVLIAGAGKGSSQFVTLKTHTEGGNTNPIILGYSGGDKGTPNYDNRKQSMTKALDKCLSQTTGTCKLIVFFDAFFHIFRFSNDLFVDEGDIPTKLNTIEKDITDFDITDSEKYKAWLSNAKKDTPENKVKNIDLYKALLATVKNSNKVVNGAAKILIVRNFKTDGTIKKINWGGGIKPGMEFIDLGSGKASVTNSVSGKATLLPTYDAGELNLKEISANIKSTLLSTTESGHLHAEQEVSEEAPQEENNVINQLKNNILTKVRPDYICIFGHKKIADKAVFNHKNPSLSDEYTPGINETLLNNNYKYEDNFTDISKGFYIYKKTA